MTTERRSEMSEMLNPEPTVMVETPLDEEEVIEENAPEVEDDEERAEQPDEEEEEESEDEESEDDESEEGEEDEEESEEDGQDEDESEEDEQVELPEPQAKRLDVITAIDEALRKTDYPIDFDADPDEEGYVDPAQEMAARLTDAHALYDIIRTPGIAAVEVLFNRITQLQGQQVTENVAGKLLEYFAQIGLIERNEEDGSFLDTKIPTDDKGQRQPQPTEAERQAEAHKQAIYNSFMKELKKLSKDADIDDEDFEEFIVPKVARAINGDRLIINRIARGNFVDVKRLFTEASNRLVARTVKSVNKKTETRKNRDKRFPKRVPATGGDRKTASAEPQINSSSRESRIAGAKTILSR